MKSHPLRILILCSTVALLAACGGGGGGGKLGNSGGGGGDWQQGIFLDADTFFNQCQNPVGTNPFTNQAYGAGSTLDENNFLRSFSDNTYLWYDDYSITRSPISMNCGRVAHRHQGRPRTNFISRTPQTNGLTCPGAACLPDTVLTGHL
jgi:hypothetical protein